MWRPWKAATPRNWISTPPDPAGWAELAGRTGRCENEGRRARSGAGGRAGRSAVPVLSCWASDVEPERAELLAAVVGDLVRAPRRQPDPIFALVDLPAK